MSQPPMIERVEPPRWLNAVQGVVGIVVGVLLLLAPGASTAVLVQLIGLWWVIAGVVSLVSLAWDRSQWGWTILSGIIGIAAGLAIVRHPLWSSVLVGGALIVFLGVVGIALGVTLLIRAFGHGDWGMGVLGAVDVLVGLVLIFNPLAAVIALPFVLGGMAIVGGIASLVAAIRGPGRPTTDSLGAG